MLSQSVEETHKIAKELLDKLKNKNVICLYGELGAGKTTFVQGLARALGIKKRVISPTFVLLREYKIENCSIVQLFNYQFLYHVDCYRINSEEDIKSIDLGEIWSNPKNLVVIEWAERISKILPKDKIEIKFSYAGENKRKIEITN